MANDPVLLVDPDPAFLRSIQRVFDAAGLDLDTASTGEEALLMLTATPYGVTISATDLTDMTPQRFFARVALLRPDCETIALVSSRDIEFAADLYDHGNLFNHLWKPLDDVGDLTRQVGRAFERRALKRHNAYLLTELRDAREELHRQSEFLVRVEKLAVLGHSLPGLATEIAEPLQELRTSAERLRSALAQASGDGWSRAQARELARLAERIAEIGGACEDRVREVAGLCSEPAEAEPHSDLRNVLQAAVAFQRHTAEARGIAVRLDVPDDLPPVRASAPALRQALTHVIVNAIQSMPQGGVLHMVAEADARGSENVQITIRDTGTGIPPHCLPHIFEPFYTTRAPGEGTGLGLHIARSVIRRHGGDIHVQTRCGEGTTVCVSLPSVRTGRQDAPRGTICAAA